MMTEYLQYDEAKQALRGLNIPSRKAYLQIAKRREQPKGVPADPYRFYKSKGQWSGWSDFLSGTSPRRRAYSTARDYAEAMAIASNLGMKSRQEYIRACKTNTLDPRLPTRPDCIYRKHGFRWSDYLGLDDIEAARSIKKLRSYDDAVKFLIANGVNTKAAYFKLAGDPINGLPKRPSHSYKKLWVSWYAFFGLLGKNSKKMFKNESLPFEQAKRIVQAFGFENLTSYQNAIDRGLLPSGLPRWPSSTYKKKGWTNLADFFGTESSRFYTFEKAKEILAASNIRTRAQFRKYASSESFNTRIPPNPAYVYRKSGWSGWSDFLSSEWAERKLVGYQTAKRILAPLGLQTRADFMKARARGQIPSGIPQNPQVEYKRLGEWPVADGWSDFLTAKVATFQEAKGILKAFNLMSRAEYCAKYEAGHLPRNLPANPGRYYTFRGEWAGWDELLSVTESDPTRKRESPSFETVSSTVKQLGISSIREYKEHWNDKLKVLGYPKSPLDFFAKRGTWEGADKFFGKQYPNYAEVQKMARAWAAEGSLGSKPTLPKFLALAESRKVPLPRRRNVFLKFYGKEYEANENFFLAAEAHAYMPFSKAKEVARFLQVTSSTHWDRLHREGIISKSFPRFPWTVYKSEWQGWHDFLSKQQRRRLTVAEVQELCQHFGLKDIAGWREFAKTDLAKNIGVPVDVVSHLRRAGHQFKLLELFAPEKYAALSAKQA